MKKIFIYVAAVFVIVASAVSFFIKNKVEEKNVDLITKNEVVEDLAPINKTDSQMSSPDVYTDKSNLQTLDLSGKGLKQTPQSVFTETETQKLDLSNNKLNGSLQAEIRQLKNLKVLNLNNNQFTGVPAEIGQLKNLEILNLSNNQITGLPLELGNLTNLKILNLKGNDYSEFDLGLIKEKLPASTVIEVD